MTEHLQTDRVAAYLDGVLTPAERAHIEAHLADCDECRAELTALARVLHTRPRRRRPYILAGIAAAAAVVALLVWPRPHDESLPNFREPAVTTTIAPVGIAPRGATAFVPRLIWTRVPHAQGYRVTVFDTAGAVIWESPTKDTVIALPKTIKLRARTRYFWQVEAETGFDRSVKSDVLEFTLSPAK